MQTYTKAQLDRKIQKFIEAKSPVIHESTAHVRNNSGDRKTGMFEAIRSLVPTRSTLQF